MKDSELIEPNPLVATEYMTTSPVQDYLANQLPLAPTIGSISDAPPKLPDLPEPFTGDMWAYLLVNALRFLNNEQRDGLCYDLFMRSDNKETICKRFNEFMALSEKNGDVLARVQADLNQAEDTLAEIADLWNCYKTELESGSYNKAQYYQEKLNELLREVRE